MFTKFSFKSFQVLAIATASLVSANAFAARYTYLGGAASLAHCQIIAGRAGFTTATFGGYVNGIYYWNACLGSNSSPTYNPTPVPQPVQPMTMLRLAEVVEDHVLDFDWHVVDHDDSPSLAIHNQLNADTNRLYSQSEDLTAKARQGATRYELRNEIQAMQRTYLSLRSNVAYVNLFFDESDTRYWNRLVSIMNRLITVQ